MNITPIISKIYNNTYNQPPKYQYNPLIKPQYKNQLTQDTVSFGMGSKAIQETIWHNFVKDLPRLKRIGMTYLDVTESIANKLKADGLEFVRDMFEATVVKEPDSKISKVNRSKTFDVRDAIRTTLFVKNPYDVSILFNKILPEYKLRGYNVATIPTSVSDLMKRGYIPLEEGTLITEFFNIPHTKESHNKYFRELKKLGYDYDDTKKLLAEYLKENKTPNKNELIQIIGTLKKDMPDIDIRLKKKNINTSDIPEEYKYTLGKPQKSEYEDIQIRFIRDVDKDSKEPIYHELLIQFGPTYNRNAFREHKLVYEPIRLFDELNINMDTQTKGIEDYKLFPENGVSKFISDIRKMFREGVSKKLIQNGKNEDYLHDTEDNKEIFFTEKDEKDFKRRFKNIKGFLAEYYNQAKERAKVSSMTTELIENDFEADMKLVNKIQKMLKQTMDTLNYEHGLKD